MSTVEVPLPGFAPALVEAGQHGRLVRWRAVTAIALLAGYGGYYVCRSNLSVATPALLADPASGLDRAAIGLISSAGIFAYAAGKSVTGIAGDFLGGRTLFLGGLFLSVLATLAFGAGGGLPTLLAIWIANRFVQSAGWGGVTKIAAHWYPATRYGAVMSLLSLSFLFGDAAGRYLLGSLLSGGVSWRMLFVVAAAVLATIGVIDLVVLRDTPLDRGLPEPPVSPDNVFGAAGAATRPANLRDLLAPYLQSPSFWMVCGMACGTTLIREAFNTWIPIYLVEVHRLAPGLAARHSALFPLIGGVSALLVGAATDRFRHGNRAVLLAPAMALCTACLAVLAVATTARDLTWSMLAIGTTAFCLLGPYTLLAGAIAMDLGGRKGSATAAGLIDTAGYAGGALGGFAIGGIVDAGGWVPAFQAMAIVAAAVAALAFAYRADRRRPLPPPHPRFA